MQISLNKNKIKDNLEYYHTFPGFCQSLLSAVGSLHAGDSAEQGAYISAEVHAKEPIQEEGTSKIPHLSCIRSTQERFS